MSGLVARRVLTLRSRYRLDERGTRLTRRFSDRMLALMESVDLPGPQAGDPGSAGRPA
jgi:hypothetical protein